MDGLWGEPYSSSKALDVHSEFFQRAPCQGPSWASKWVCLPVPEMHIPEKLSQNAPALFCIPRELVTALPVVSSHRDGMFWQWLWFYTRFCSLFVIQRFGGFFSMHPTSTDMLKWPVQCISLHLVTVQVFVLSNFMAHFSTPWIFSNSRILKNHYQ